MAYPRKWEEITGGQYAGYNRLKVFGGWLVSYWTQSAGCEQVLFIADSKHEWQLEETEAKG